MDYSVSSASGTPTGDVTVGDGTDSCTDSVSTGSCTLTFTTAGTKSLTATYVGNENFNGSTSASETHIVDEEQTDLQIYLPLLAR